MIACYYCIYEAFVVLMIVLNIHVENENRVSFYGLNIFYGKGNQRNSLTDFPGATNEHCI